MPRSIDRMRREIEAEGVAFGGHALSNRPRGIARKADRRGLRAVRAEQPSLAAGPLVVRACGMGEDRLRGGEDSRPLRLDAVEGAGGGETLELPPIEQPGIDPRCEILEAGERSAARPLVDKRLHRLLANALQRSERVADAVSLSPILDGEMGMADVDVRRQALKPG